MQYSKPSHARMCSLCTHASWLLKASNYIVIPLHYDTSKDDTKCTII